MQIQTNIFIVRSLVHGIGGGVVEVRKIEKDITVAVEHLENIRDLIGKDSENAIDGIGFVIQHLQKAIHVPIAGNGEGIISEPESEIQRHAYLIAAQVLDGYTLSMNRIESE